MGILITMGIAISITMSMAMSMAISIAMSIIQIRNQKSEIKNLKSLIIKKKKKNNITSYISNT